MEPSHSRRQRQLEARAGVILRRPGSAGIPPCPDAVELPPEVMVLRIQKELGLSQEPCGNLRVPGEPPPDVRQSDQAPGPGACQAQLLRKHHGLGEGGVGHGQTGLGGCYFAPENPCEGREGVWGRSVSRRCFLPRLRQCLQQGLQPSFRLGISEGHPRRRREAQGGFSRSGLRLLSSGAWEGIEGRPPPRQQRRVPPLHGPDGLEDDLPGIGRGCRDLGGAPGRTTEDRGEDEEQKLDSRHGSACPVPGRGRRRRTGRGSCLPHRLVAR